MPRRMSLPFLFAQARAETRHDALRLRGHPADKQRQNDRLIDTSTLVTHASYFKISLILCFFRDPPRILGTALKDDRSGVV